MARHSRFELRPVAWAAFRFARFRFVFAPTVDECLSMVADLGRYYGGKRRTAELLCVSVATLQSWQRRKTMCMSSRRLIWLIWALAFHPERLENEFDAVTWGRCAARLRS